MLVPEKVTYDAKSKLIRVRAWGADRIQDWLSSRQQVYNYHATHGSVQLLVDARDQETTPTISEIYFFGKSWAPRIRTAILVGEATTQEQEFLETVALNRARIMRIFDDEEDALNWLAQDRKMRSAPFLGA